MDLEDVENILYHKEKKAKVKGNTIISYNLLLSILHQIDKLHKYNEMQSLYDNMYKSNIDMAGQLRELKEQLRIATEQRAKSKIGKMEAQNRRALKYIQKMQWLDIKERNDLENILGEKYD